MGRYALDAVIGRGGMGTVYRGRDLVLVRQVAVKVMADGLDEDRGYAERFEREARIAARVAHPAVVMVFDSGVDDGARFIVMEHVAGSSLSQVLRERGALATAEAMRIAAAIADGLSAVHAAGLVHRDLKPSNVMLGDDGVVKVLDFGVAYSPAATALTQTATVLGSAPYISPEQARGERGDTRSDIYSLGCLFYALIAGRPPFAAESPAAVLHQHLHVVAPPLPNSGSQASRELAGLVARMLAKRQDDRPQSATAVRDTLDAISDRASATAVRDTLDATSERASATATLAVGAAGGTSRSGPGTIATRRMQGPYRGSGRRRAIAIVTACAAVAAAITVALAATLGGGGGADGGGGGGGAAGGAHGHTNAHRTVTTDGASSSTTNANAASAGSPAAENSTAITGSPAANAGGPANAGAPAAAGGGPTNATGAGPAGTGETPSAGGPSAAGSPANGAESTGASGPAGAQSQPGPPWAHGGGGPAGGPGQYGAPPGHGGVPPGQWRHGRR